MKTGLNNPARGRDPKAQDYRTSLYLQKLIGPAQAAYSNVADWKAAPETNKELIAAWDKQYEPQPDRVTRALWYLNQVESNMGVVCRVRQDWPYRDVMVAAEYMRAAMMLLRGEAEKDTEG